MTCRDRKIAVTVNVIPFFIVSKSSVGETILKIVLSHFSKNTVTYIQMTSSSKVTIFFKYVQVIHHLVAL